MEKIKVMIVDDEKDFLRMAKLNLENTQRFEVLTLSDASNILEDVKSFKPNIILLDIVMPKTDGFKICKMLKDDPESQRIPIVALSALDTNRDKSIMHELGVVDFVVKPVEKDELISRIEIVLKGLS